MLISCGICLCICFAGFCSLWVLGHSSVGFWFRRVGLRLRWVLWLLIVCRVVFVGFAGGWPYGWDA